LILYFRTDALVLKNSDYRESDKLVTVFSRERGKIRAVARGVKKPRSSLRACVQPFCHTHLYFRQGKGLDLLTQGKLLHFFPNCREDFDRLLDALYIIELLDKTTMEQAALPGLFDTALEVLTYLNDQGQNPLLMRLFEVHLLVELGYHPELVHCVHCGQAVKNPTIFDLPQGGVVCSSCAASTGSNFPLAADSLALFRFLTTASPSILNRIKPSPAALDQLKLFLEKYLEYHLEQRFQFRKT
jgi:DNA repair protein RecO (recombination protein O)